ncbi:uncharacterized protein BDV17DRAFT_136871 [Aspergillus undulatus]|uniref:uncharacterized protein n=1 Tax=Aspergillus undulatus TaxID=1810928 RepID=UPI003CCD9975
MQPGEENTNNEPSRPGTPPQPPYSPVTPVFAHLTPVHPTTNGTSHPIVPPATSPSPTSQAPPSYNAPSHLNSSSIPPSRPAPIPPTFAPEPSPVPISESENPDAIALRSAISILQLQKQQSLRDIRTLEKMKIAAAEDPERFVRDLAEGKLTRKEQGGFLDFNHDEDDEGESGGGAENEDRNGSGLGTLPTAQNVVRMPPVNWAKYQVVGDSLDKMHEEQLRRPSLGEPRRDEAPAPEYMLASPYRPLVDKLESPTKAKGASKDKKGSG